MSAPALEMKSLSKRYGSQLAIDGVDLHVDDGAIFGYLGPNGAGKTTTIRIIMGFIRADSGSLKIFGKEAGRHGVELRRQIGYIPGELSLYGHLNGSEFLRFIAALQGHYDPGVID